MKKGEPRETGSRPKPKGVFIIRDEKITSGRSPPSPGPLWKKDKKILNQIFPTTAGVLPHQHLPSGVSPKRGQDPKTPKRFLSSP